MIKRLLEIFTSSAEKTGKPEVRRFGLGGGLGNLLSNYSSVNSGNISGIPAAIACIRVIAETVATLPVHLYRSDKSGNRELVSNHPVAQLLGKSPNNYMTSVQFFEAMMYQVLVHGNAYAQIRYKKNGKLHDINPLIPEYMQVMTDETRDELRYLYRGEIALRQSEVLHIRGLSSNGLIGISPLEASRETLELNMNLEKQANSFFKNGAMPGGVLEHPKRLSEDAARNLRESWNNLYAGSSNAFRTAILEEGISYKPLAFNSRDSQLLESREFQVTEIARIYRVPPHMIQDLSKATFSNIEAQAIDFVRHTIRPWLVRLEASLNQALLGNSNDLFIEFKADGILRGDTNTRYSAYSTGIQNGFLSINEVRRLENLNTIDVEAGDVFLRPLNMQVVKSDGTAVNNEVVVDPQDSVRQKLIQNVQQRFASKFQKKLGSLLRSVPKSSIPDDFEAFINKQNIRSQLELELSPLDQEFKLDDFLANVSNEVRSSVKSGSFEHLLNDFNSHIDITQYLHEE